MSARDSCGAIRYRYCALQEIIANKTIPFAKAGDGRIASAELSGWRWYSAMSAD